MWDRNQREWGPTQPEPAVEWGTMLKEWLCKPPSLSFHSPLPRPFGRREQAEERLSICSAIPLPGRGSFRSRNEALRHQRLEAFAGPDAQSQLALSEKVRFFLSASQSTANRYRRVK